MADTQERLSDNSVRRQQAKSKRRTSRFVKGPIPLAWLSSACGLGGKVGQVVLAIWYARGLNGEPVALTASLLTTFGVTPKTGRSVLARLETAGLVTVERRRGRCPRVTVIPVKATTGHKA